MKKIITSFLFLFLIGCSANKPQPKTQIMPLSKQATFVESTNSNEVIIKSTGKGKDFKSALLDAKKAAIWYVLFASDRAILKTYKQKEKVKPYLKEIFSNVDNYIRWQSDVKDKRYIGKTLLLTYYFKIDVNSLKEYLANKGVIKTTDELSEEVAYPYIALIPKSEDAKIAANTIAEYLQDRDFEVVVSEDSKINKIIKKVAMIEGVVDPAYEKALSIGSDIYISVDAKVSKINRYGVTFLKGVVFAKAYETATGKQLAAATGYSPQRQASKYAVIQEASNDTADKITSQIKKSWIKILKRGNPFKIVLITDIDGMNDKFYYFLKKIAKRVKLLASGKSIASFIIYNKDKNIENALDLFEKIKRKFRGKISKIFATGKFLIVKISNNDEEITIE